MFRFSVFFIFLFSLCSEARDIKGGYPDHFPPFSIAGEQVTGIIPDLLKATNQYSEHAYYAGPYARKALRMLSEGQLDFLFDSQRWTKNAEQYYWSTPITLINDVLILPIDATAQFASVDDLIHTSRLSAKPMRLGTRYEYTYPTLDDAFAKGDLAKRNFYSDFAMLRALMKSEQTGIDAIVMSEFVYDFLILNNPHLQHRFKKAGFIIDQAPYQFAFPKTNDGKLNMLITNQALARLHATGKIEEIIKRYAN
ncbi:ABC transporter substrate-binding protein [Pseudoalteromonas sp. YIC-656]|uniref:substrate-binding periplasmic protein n=1 Tax=Pseudoalteromonas pernae TaxID=3118054 RepID=UPI0032426CC6